jgi:hypothetical protein
MLEVKNEPSDQELMERLMIFQGDLDPTNQSDILKLVRLNNKLLARINRREFMELKQNPELARQRRLDKNMRMIKYKANKIRAMMDLVKESELIISPPKVEKAQMKDYKELRVQRQHKEDKFYNKAHPKVDTNIRKPSPELDKPQQHSFVQSESDESINPVNKRVHRILGEEGHSFGTNRSSDLSAEVEVPRKRIVSLGKAEVKRNKPELHKRQESYSMNKLRKSKTFFLNKTHELEDNNSSGKDLLFEKTIKIPHQNPHAHKIPSSIQNLKQIRQINSKQRNSKIISITDFKPQYSNNDGQIFFDTKHSNMTNFSPSKSNSPSHAGPKGLKLINAAHSSSNDTDQEAKAQGPYHKGLSQTKIPIQQTTNQHTLAKLRDRTLPRLSEVKLATQEKPIGNKQSVDAFLAQMSKEELRVKKNKLYSNINYVKNQLSDFLVKGVGGSIKSDKEDGINVMNLQGFTALRQKLKDIETFVNSIKPSNVSKIDSMFDEVFNIRNLAARIYFKQDDNHSKAEYLARLRKNDELVHYYASMPLFDEAMMKNLRSSDYSQQKISPKRLKTLELSKQVKTGNNKSESKEDTPQPRLSEGGDKSLLSPVLSKKAFKFPIKADSMMMENSSPLLNKFSSPKSIPKGQKQSDQLQLPEPSPSIKVLQRSRKKIEMDNQDRLEAFLKGNKPYYHKIKPKHNPEVANLGLKLEKKDEIDEEFSDDSLNSEKSDEFRKKVDKTKQELSKFKCFKEGGYDYMVMTNQKYKYLVEQLKILDEESRRRSYKSEDSSFNAVQRRDKLLKKMEEYSKTYSTLLTEADLTNTVLPKSSEAEAEKIKEVSRLMQETDHRIKQKMSHPGSGQLIFETKADPRMRVIKGEPVKLSEFKKKLNQTVAESQQINKQLQKHLAPTSDFAEANLESVVDQFSEA